MTRTELANMTRADLCALIGVNVTRTMNDAGFIVYRVTLEGCGHKLVDLPHSRLRPWLIDAVMAFDEGGAFA